MLYHLDTAHSVPDAAVQQCHSKHVQFVHKPFALPSSAHGLLGSGCQQNWYQSRSSSSGLLFALLDTARFKRLIALKCLSLQKFDQLFQVVFAGFSEQQDAHVLLTPGMRQSCIPPMYRKRQVSAHNTVSTLTPVYAS